MIKFNQLKEINLSENEITDIEPICIMNLPFLEFLNLSYNKIKNISPLGELNSRKLKYLFLQNNQIENLEDIKFLCDCDYPNLKILRFENNKIQENSDPFKKFFDKYKKKQFIIVTNAKIDEIKIKYSIEYDERSEKIEVQGVEEKKENEVLDNKKEDEEDELLLKNLFIIISQKNENRIKTLKLSNCKIKNPSILNRIQFDFLEELDLSINNIKNLKFLKGMRAKCLKNLFLNDNCICDLSLLYNLEDKKLFPDLELISLVNNKFNLEDKDKEELKKYFAKYNLNI
jgi:Leucine-rich repeat (LRR) protein